MNMRYYILLIILLFASSTEIILRAQDITGAILNSWNSQQDTETGNKSTRTENLELINKIIKQARIVGNLNGDPIVQIDSLVFSYKEYKSVRDTLSILEGNKVKGISIYSESCSKEVLRLLGESGQSQVVVIDLDNQIKKDDPLKNRP